MDCRKCGQPVLDTPFCGACGHPAAWTSAPDSNPSAGSPGPNPLLSIPSPVPVPPRAVPLTPARQSEGLESTPVPRRGGSGTVVVILGGVVLLVAILSCCLGGVERGMTMTHRFDHPSWVPADPTVILQDGPTHGVPPTPEDPAHVPEKPDRSRR